MSERKCPHNGAVLQPDAKRGLWVCTVVACENSWAVRESKDGVDAAFDAYDESFCRSVLTAVDEYQAPMTAAEQMEALGQEKLL